MAASIKGEAPMDNVRVGLVGSGFVSEIHALALKQVPGAEVVAVASPTPGHAEQFAHRHAIPAHHLDYRHLYDRKDVDLVILGLPNDLHCEATVLAAQAGKHVVVEKPLAPSLAECDRMIEACDRAGVILGYAEEICFAPKYVRMKELADEGAFGPIHLVKQSEKHDGPHSDWFYDIGRSGGGVAFDMGCHAVEFFRWFLGTRERKAAVRGVYAQMNTFVHKHRTQADDEALLIIDFDGGVVGLAEESWCKPGGMDDRAEVFGAQGQAYADLLHGSAIRAYSRTGFGYAVEKAGATTGWSFPVAEELWNYGFPQEMQHFVDCVRWSTVPTENGHDGRAVVEVIHAAYASAARRERVALPFASVAKRPIDHWIGPDEDSEADEGLDYA
jgi:predicted dehydrogenase